MKKPIKTGLGFISIYSGYAWIVNRLRGALKIKDLTVLGYHRVIDIERDSFHFNPRVVSVSPRQFEEQVKYLDKHFNIVSLDTVVETVLEEKELPENPVIVTFDDGYKDVYQNVYPILKKYSAPATVFISTGYIESGRLFWWDKIAYLINKTDKRSLKLSGLGEVSLRSPVKRQKVFDKVADWFRAASEEDKERLMSVLEKEAEVDIDDEVAYKLYLSWDNIREMSKNGIGFGAHTIFHPVLARVSEEVQKHEILKSKETIEAKTGIKVSTFAYPQGNIDNFTRTTEKLLRDCGLNAGVTHILGTNNLNQKDFSLYRLRRIGIANETHLSFISKVRLGWMNKKRVFKNEPWINVYKNMDTTEKLIAYAAKDDGSIGKKEGILKLLDSSIDWQKLVSISEANGVDSIIYRSLKDVGNGKVPDEVLDKLKDLHTLKVAGSLVFTHGLTQIIESLNQLGIKNIVLKGPFLAEKVYADPNLRHYADLDILIQEEDVEKARSALNKLGYWQHEKNWKLFLDEGRTQYHFYKKGMIPVELHWELVNNRNYPFLSEYFRENIWKNVESVELAEENTWALSPEILLTYLCIHLSVHHKFYKLMWYKDIDQLIRSENEVDWKNFVASAKKYRFATYCYYPLVLTKELFDTHIPEEVLDNLRPQFKLARMFEYLLKRENLLDGTRRGRRLTEQFWRVLRDRPDESLKALRRRVFPRVEWYIHYYPFLPRAREAYYYPFYPLLMVLRLARRPGARPNLVRRTDQNKKNKLKKGE